MDYALIRTIFLITLCIFLFFFVIPVITDISLNSTTWRYYELIYKTLKKEDWSEMVNGGWWIYEPESSNTVRMCWFPNDSIMLKKGIYLHTSLQTWHDPYSLYWHWKFNNWFKYNLLNK